MTVRRYARATLALLTLVVAGCAGQTQSYPQPGASDNGYVLFRVGTGVPPGENMPEAYSGGIFQWSALVIRNVETGEAYRVWRDDRTWLDPNILELPPGNYYFDKVRTLVWASHDSKSLTGPEASFEIRPGCVTYVGEWRLVALIDKPFMKPVVRMDTATVDKAREVYPDVFASDPEVIVVNPVERASTI